MNSYRAVVLAYAAIGVIFSCLMFVAALVCYRGVQRRTALPALRDSVPLHRSRGIVFKLCSLFGLDAFAGGFVIQSIVAYWFHIRFGVDPTTLGAIFFGANILAPISALVAARVAARIGLVNTMVFTHLPSNILLILVPLMPNLALATGVFLLRFSISQMDVPTRQSYTMAVVASGRTLRSCRCDRDCPDHRCVLSPALAGLLISNPALIRHTLLRRWWSKSDL